MITKLFARVKSPNLILRIRNKIQRNCQVLWRNVILLIHFNSKWYLKNNPDVKLTPLKHYWKFGLREQRNPCAWISTSALDWYNKYDKSQSTLLLRNKKTNVRDFHDKDYYQQQNEIAVSYQKHETLLIFFNLASDSIGGGMLSINRFVEAAKIIVAKCPMIGVAMSGLPLKNKVVNYTYFKAALQPVEFKILSSQVSPSKVVIFVPELFFVEFISELTSEDCQWFNSLGNLKIVVMNQNNDLMPSLEMFRICKRKLEGDVMITTAHIRYCTQELSNKYSVNVKQLTPFAPILNIKSFVDREKIIILSPDPMKLGKYSREFIVKKLEILFPEFKLVTIENMSFPDYLELASKAMFSITFGEGMDGYFIEPVLSGGISFAVYNETFFPVDFKNAQTVCSDWGGLLELIENIVPKLIANSVLYDSTARLLHAKLANYYSYEQSFSELLHVLQGKYDYTPKFNFLTNLH